MATFQQETEWPGIELRIMLRIECREMRTVPL
jgi:hypothetical protein